MELIDIVFRERSGFRDMQLRPFHADATQDLIRQLNDDTSGGADLTPSALSRTAGRIIRPLANVTTPALIANGWGEKRFMFIMSVQVRKSRGATSILEITGHTDNAESINSLRGVKLPEDLALYFNSITEINQTYVDRPGSGGSWMTQIAGSHHVIGPQTLPNFSRDRLSPGTMTMRPEDVFHSNPKSILQNSFSRRVEQETDFLDMRNSFTSRSLRLSNRWNDSSTRYLHRSLKALSTANNGEVYGDNLTLERDPGEVMKDARSQVRERTFSQIPVFSELNRDTAIMDQGFITYGELIRMNPDFPWSDVKVFFERPETARNYAETTSAWDGRNNTSIAAVQIARALPTYMEFHHIAYVEFDANNTSYTGEPVILIPEVLPMMGQAINQQALQSFEQRLATELFVDMLPWEGCPFELWVKATLRGEVIINIKLGNEDPEEFAFPVFCDSLVAPVVVDDQRHIEDMSNTLVNIVESVGDYDGEEASSLIVPSRNCSF